MKNVFAIFGYLAPFKKYAFLNILLNCLSTVFSLFTMTMVIPFLEMLFQTQPDVVEPQPFGFSFDAIMNIFKYHVFQITQAHGKIAALVFISVGVVVCALFKTGFSYLASYFMAPIGNGTIKMFQTNIYNKVLDLPLKFFSESKKGDILARFTSDVQEIRSSITGSLDMLFKDPIQIIFYLAYLIYASPELTVFVFVILPVVGYIIGRIGKSLKQNSAMGQAKFAEILSIMEETLGGLRIIKAFNAEKKMKERFDKCNLEYYNLQNKIYRKHDLSSPLSEFMGTMVVSIILIAGGFLILSDDYNSGFTSAQFIAYVAIFSQILNPAKQFARTFNTINKGMASLDRVNAILNETMHVPEKENPINITEFKDSIEFKNVSFKYNEKYVLKDINLKINKGQTVALVGQSGSGKTTMVDLLPRFWDVVEGEILVDGVNVQDYKLKDLRALMGNVNQESILFNDSIKNNIKFGVSDASDEQVIAAAKIANAYDFIMEKPNQFEENVGDRGSKLSGGQRQRISIARAVLKNPPLLILDEATSALDTESEKLVQDALSNILKRHTAIVIAHRLSTVRDADVICVLQDGKIIETGKHDELIAQNGAYKRLCDLQMF